MLALIIDDEIQIRRLLRLALESAGFAVREAAVGQGGLQEAAFHRPDVILLDLGLPDMDGLAVLKRLREWSEVPVLILSVRDQDAVKIAALEGGADDYVTKPFSTAELLARVRAILRRQSGNAEPLSVVGPLTLDLLHHEATLLGSRLALSPTEFALMKLLMRYVGRIVTQKQILREVWGGQNSDASQALRVHVNHLRKKLSNAPQLKIQNEPGIGYRLVDGS
jgi:two-component system KDP operon response regulator KdpE